MGMKDEVREAKELATAMQHSGDTLLKIAERLNLAYAGFYYVADGRVYRENVPDYAPPVRIL